MTLIKIQGLQVVKSGTVICSVPELCIETGERLAVVGNNGSGKTTLFRALAGLEHEYRGTCSVDIARRDRVYVHQSPYLFRGTVLGNITYGLRARRLGRAESERSAWAWLQRLGIDDLAKRRVDHLSGGERRRVALARAMILKPRLLLLDEPLADMDAAGAVGLSAGLDELKQCTVLVASPTKVLQGLTTRTYRLEPSAPGPFSTAR